MSRKWSISEFHRWIKTVARYVILVAQDYAFTVGISPSKSPVAGIIRRREWISFIISLFAFRFLHSSLIFGLILGFSYLWLLNGGLGKNGRGNGGVQVVQWRVESKRLVLGARLNRSIGGGDER
ncbi:hypothetical protein V6N12_000188 [Hibiscus sabdariffa]|uniref:Uncharacterized protein n=1 Tax=Hibiscus sabdariffa TaxID=183260 RepID=A0ABR2ATV6_9ROSI